MSYSTSNPPHVIAPRMGDGGTALWGFRSTEGTTLISSVSGYFSNGKSLGMKVGDVVFVTESDNSYALSVGSVTAISTAGAATIVIGSLTST